MIISRNARTPLTLKSMWYACSFKRLMFTNSYEFCVEKKKNDLTNSRLILRKLLSDFAPRVMFFVRTEFICMDAGIPSTYWKKLKSIWKTSWCVYRAGQSTTIIIMFSTTTVFPSFYATVFNAPYVVRAYLLFNHFVRRNKRRRAPALQNWSKYYANNAFTKKSKKKNVNFQQAHYASAVFYSHDGCVL